MYLSDAGVETMGFINDEDRRTHVEFLHSVAQGEARLTEEARTMLIASFEKLAEQVMRNARSTLIYDGVVHQVFVNPEYSTTICEPHHHAALAVYTREPELLTQVLNRAMGMTEGDDYTIVKYADTSSSYRIHTAYECCGWQDGLQIGVHITFSPPLR